MNGSLIPSTNIAYPWQIESIDLVDYHWPQPIRTVGLIWNQSDVDSDLFPVSPEHVTYIGGQKKQIHKHTKNKTKQTKQNKNKNKTNIYPSLL